MPRSILIILIVAGGTLLLGTLAFFFVIQASRRVPKFYSEALAADPEKQAKASDEMLQRTTALASDAKKAGPWQAVFTSDQINGWLAVDLVKNHPEMLTENLRDIRVDIAPNRLTVACRAELDSVQGVVSITVDAHVTKTNVIAIRFQKARLGIIPLPLDKLLRELLEGTKSANLNIQLTQANGAPVALIAIPQPQDGKRINVEAIELGEDELFITGTTKPKDD